MTVEKVSFANSIPQYVEEIKLERCTAEHLKGVFGDEEGQTVFDNYKLEDKYCTPNNLTVKMEGKSNTYGPILKGMVITLRPCHFIYGTAPSVICWGEAIYNNIISQYLLNVPFLKGQLYLFNTGFNPQ